MSAVLDGLGVGSWRGADAAVASTAFAVPLPSILSGKMYLHVGAPAWGGGQTTSAARIAAPTASDSRAKLML